MKQTRKWAILLTGGALALTVAIGATAAFAQEPTPTPTPKAQVAPGLPGFGFHGWHGGSTQFDELLAQELGITVEQLKAAKDAAYNRALDQAVQDGTLTQEQADLLKAKQALRSYIDEEAIVAEALGMTVEELQNAKAAGQSLAEILEAQGLDLATYRDALQQAYEDAVAQAVADGVITQAQADQILSGPGLGGFGGRHGFGGRPSFRGPRGGGFWNGPGITAPDSGA